MHLLTPENLNQNYYRYNDYVAYQRGMTYYQSGMVRVVEFNLDSATLQVTGKQGNYTVTIKAISKERVSAACQCSESTRTGYCRHIVAALMGLRDYIQSEASKNWQYRLSMALEKTPKKPRARKEIEKSITLLGLEVNKQNNGEFSGFVYPFKVGAADYVYHLDPWWNPAVPRQAADRVHRIGQDKPVFIYKFIARDTVEEKILKLQEHKKELVDQLISAEDSFFKTITLDDVKVLFS